MTLCEKPVPCSVCPLAESCTLDQERHAFWLADHRLAQIGRRILVLSNKGGVGKSTVTAHLALSLARRGLRVGLLDADLSGPSQPFLFGVEGTRVRASAGGLVPPEPAPGLKLVSSACFLENPDDALMWRDSYKFEFLLGLVGGVAWGPLDYLLVDMPPGTGGELIGLRELLGRVDGAIVITTPQRMALLDVRRAVTACRDSGLPVLGIVENMSGMLCPHCGGKLHPFRRGGGEETAMAMGVPFLGRVPLDRRLLEELDEGRLLQYDDPGALSSRALEGIADRLVMAQIAD